jgi:hypothetical protein
MNERSGVSHPKAGRESLEKDNFDHETASWELLEDLAKDVSEDVILETGKIPFGAIKLSDALAHS